jgi:hypothetical protein
LKVDFWDINEMANRMIAVLRHPSLASTLRQLGGFEVSQMSWSHSARACVMVYESARAHQSDSSLLRGSPGTILEATEKYEDSHVRYLVRPHLLDA